MRCDEFESRINQLLDERQVPHDEQDVADHAGTCEACAGVLTSYRQVLDVVQSTKSLEMDGDPAEAIVAQVQLAARRRRRFWSVLVPLTVAASLLIALAPLLKMRIDETNVADSPDSKSSEPVIADGTNTEKSSAIAAAPNEEPPTDLQRMAKGMGKLWDGVVKGRTSSADDPTRPSDADDLGSEQRNWVTDMSEDLKPLADTMVAALSAMRRTLPDTGGGEPPSS